MRACMCQQNNSKINYRRKNKFDIFNLHHMEMVLETFCKYRANNLRTGMRRIIPMDYILQGFLVSKINRSILTLLLFIFQTLLSAVESEWVWISNTVASQHSFLCLKKWRDIFPPLMDIHKISKYLFHRHETKISSYKMYGKRKLCKCYVRLINPNLLKCKFLFK